MHAPLRLVHEDNFWRGTTTRWFVKPSFNLWFNLTGCWQCRTPLKDRRHYLVDSMIFLYPVNGWSHGPRTMRGSCSHATSTSGIDQKLKSSAGDAARTESLHGKIISDSLVNSIVHWQIFFISRLAYRELSLVPLLWDRPTHITRRP